MLIGYRAGNHPQQIAKRGPRGDIDDRATSPETFGPLNERFGFTIDVASSDANTKCERYYTAEDDGLSKSWADERVWCNPPYSDIRPWVKKAWLEQDRADLIVMILPAELVEPSRDAVGSPLRSEFLPGRIRFVKPGETEIQLNNRPPFGCVLLIWETR